MSALEHLAEIAGIESLYYDVFGRPCQASDPTKRALLDAMGFAVATDAEVARSLAKADERPWQVVLEPVVVIAAERQPGLLTLTLPAGLADAKITWTLVEEDGACHAGYLRVSDCPVSAIRTLHGHHFERRDLHLPVTLPYGYHRFNIAINHPEAQLLNGLMTHLIVAPHACYGSDQVASGAKLWGITTQLYSLRSTRNWGIGDFGDLLQLIDAAAAAGAAAIGLNPLHPLYPANPGHISPYAPSSRSFLNTIYIDVAGIPEFTDSFEAQALYHDADFQADLERLRASDTVDYVAVAHRKYQILTLLFTHFQEHHLHPLTPRGATFLHFCETMGQPLERLALFDALQEYFRTQDPHCWRWREWPPVYQCPDSEEVLAFTAQHADRVLYFKYLQWIADEQLHTAAERCKERGMAVGLYLDLAVGVDPDGGEAWSEPTLLVPKVALGAPPDLLNHLGQNWGLTPINPVALREQAFAPFIAAVRSNMRHAGALRIDHVMGLMRLYWIPDGMPAHQGVYIRYPFRDLLRIIALESHRQHCIVIGEDLGTVPEGFRETMHDAGVLSYRVLYFERWPDGLFKRPDAYPAQSLVTLSTHDLPPLAGWWKGRDIEWRIQLKLYPDPAMEESDRASRPRDRVHLISALHDAGVLTTEVSADDPVLHPAVLVAIHRFLARSPSRLMLMQIEDALGLVEQMNLPGTGYDQHPNWCRKLPLPLEVLFEHGNMKAIVAALRQERPGLVQALDPATQSTHLS